MEFTQNKRGLSKKSEKYQTRLSNNGDIIAIKLSQDILGVVSGFLINLY